MHNLLVLPLALVQKQKDQIYVPLFIRLEAIANHANPTMGPNSFVKAPPRAGATMMGISGQKSFGLVPYPYPSGGLSLSDEKGVSPPCLVLSAVSSVG